MGVSSPLETNLGDVNRHSACFGGAGGDCATDGADQRMLFLLLLQAWLWRRGGRRDGDERAHPPPHLVPRGRQETLRRGSSSIPAKNGSEWHGLACMWGLGWRVASALPPCVGRAWRRPCPAWPLWVLGAGASAPGRRAYRAVGTVATDAADRTCQLLDTPDGQWTLNHAG